VLDADATVAMLTDDPPHTALFVDFDGTLSAIVERAEDARPVPGALDVLARLAAQLGRTGIISGRPVAFLASQVPLPGLVFAGLYGMEHRIDGVRSVDPRVAPYLDAVAVAVDELQSRIPVDLVEPKAGVSVTLHWRPDPARAEELQAIAAEVATRHGLALLRTRSAIELRPPVPIDKGVAVAALVDGFGIGAFGGDDSGDLPAFRALKRSSARRSVCIGVRSGEMPDEFNEEADVLVDGPAGLVALLGRVADELG
jgi:trehalose 6-phosphate phosphatase